MDITQRIDQLVANLNDLKASLQQTQPTPTAQFDAVFEQALAEVEDLQGSATPSALVQQSGVPSWVHPDYHYDPANPRKPHMIEMMEVMAGMSLQELQQQPRETYREINQIAADLLYGVVGSAADTRDWTAIMSSSDVVRAAREATGALHGVTVAALVDPVTEEPKAAVIDRDGDALRTLGGLEELVTQTMLNFGVTADEVDAAGIQNLPNTTAYLGVKQAAEAISSLSRAAVDEVVDLTNEEPKTAATDPDGETPKTLDSPARPNTRPFITFEETLGTIDAFDIQNARKQLANLGVTQAIDEFLQSSS